MKLTYQIEGMHCAACVEKIKLALSPYVKIIEITLNPPLLTIEADQPPLLSDLNVYILSAGKYQLQLAPSIKGPSFNTNDQNPTGLSAYYPIFLITGYIIGVASINNFHWPAMNWQGWMSQFMAGFFLVFSAFKLLDIKGFAQGYANYDLLAQHWDSYGYLYPFLELGLGILYLGHWLPTVTQLATVFIMGFSAMGVINSLRKKQKFQCACLGTILKVPLSSVTLVEDLTMVALAAIALMMK